MLAGEEAIEDICAVVTANSMRHLDEQKLLAAQLEVHQTLAWLLPTG